MLRDTMAAMPPQLTAAATRAASGAVQNPTTGAAAVAVAFVDGLMKAAPCDGDCPICLSELAGCTGSQGGADGVGDGDGENFGGECQAQGCQGSDVVALPCGGGAHRFHRGCLRGWAKLSARCPLCREGFSPTDPPGGTGASATPSSRATSAPAPMSHLSTAGTAAGSPAIAPLPAEPGTPSSGEQSAVASSGGHNTNNIAHVQLPSPTSEASLVVEVVPKPPPTRCPVRTSRRPSRNIHRSSDGSNQQTGIDGNGDAVGSSATCTTASPSGGIALAAHDDSLNCCIREQESRASSRASYASAIHGSPTQARASPELPPPRGASVGRAPALDGAGRPRRSEPERRARSASPMLGGIQLGVAGREVLRNAPAGAAGRRRVFADGGPGWRPPLPKQAATPATPRTPAAPQTPRVSSGMRVPAKAAGRGPTPPLSRGHIGTGPHAAPLVSRADASRQRSRSSQASA